MAAKDGYESDDNQSFKSFDDNEETQPTHHSAKITTPPPAGQTHEAQESQDDPEPPKRAVIERFPPEVEGKLLSESNEEKSRANTLFGKGSFENAIQTYDRAMAACPNYLDYEIAILRSNISACNLKLQEWKEAAEAASKGLDCLERLEPLPKLPSKPKLGEQQDTSGKDSRNDDAIQEVDEDLEFRIETLQKSGHTLSEVRKLQTKLLLRRARAKSSLPGWADLQAADEDYRLLLTPSLQSSLAPTDKKAVLEAVQKLGPKLSEARDRDMAEMMGKLKGLGNSILKPFGLSTDNFQFVKDENTGGYSMNFGQNAGKP